MKPVVLVTGAGGLIGQYMTRTAARWAPEWDVRGLTRQDADLTDVLRVTDIYRALKPHAVMHCAALSRTKDCEQQPDQARRVNVTATTHLATLAKDVPFFFLSSGEVFDGKRGWYEEGDEARPINVYGQTKLEAEQIVLQNPRHTVVRIVLTAGTSKSGDRSFIEEMRRMARSGGRVTLFEDEYRCPLPAGVIARALWELLGHERAGLYHLGGRERLSRWEIGEALIRWYPELSGRLKAGTARSYTGSPRPADLSLRCDKIQGLLSFPIPGFRSWLTNRAQAGADLWDYPYGRQ
jgi:dTDP-4-dehydrorhamnose reductase